MNKIKLLSILVGLQLALNIVALSFLFLNKDRSHERPHTREQKDSGLKEQFGFNDDQMQSFQISKEKHQEESKILRHELADASTNYYNTEVGDSNRIEHYTEVMDLTKRIYEVNTQHFDDVRSICTQDQLPTMEKFIRSLTRKINKMYRSSKRNK